MLKLRRVQTGKWSLFLFRNKLLKASSARFVMCSIVRASPTQTCAHLRASTLLFCNRVKVRMCLIFTNTCSWRGKKRAHQTWSVVMQFRNVSYLTTYKLNLTPVWEASLCGLGSDDTMNKCFILSSTEPSSFVVSKGFSWQILWWPSGSCASLKLNLVLSLRFRLSRCVTGCFHSHVNAPREGTVLQVVHRCHFDLKSLKELVTDCVSMYILYACVFERVVCNRMLWFPRLKRGVCVFCACQGCHTQYCTDSLNMCTLYSRHVSWTLTFNKLSLEMNHNILGNLEGKKDTKRRESD